MKLKSPMEIITYNELTITNNKKDFNSFGGLLSHPKLLFLLPNVHFNQFSDGCCISCNEVPGRTRHPAWLVRSILEPGWDLC